MSVAQNEPNTPGAAPPWAQPGARPLVRFEGVRKRYGEVSAVDGVTLDIFEREFFALLGPSGCGKTTLLRMLAGFEAPTSGRIMIDGRDMSRIAPNRRPVNMVFQSYAVFPHMTVEANVGYGLHRMPRDARSGAIDSALAATRAGHLAGRPVAQLSGGEAQRVALARALAPRPDLLLLDEPLSALDAATRTALRGELRQVLVEQAIPAIVVTHDRAEALTLGDRIAIVIGGRIRQVGEPAEVFDRPHDPQVAAVLGVETAVPGTVASLRDGIARVNVDDVTISATTDPAADVRVGSTVLVCIRAEDVSIQLADTSAIASQRNQVDVAITAITADGPLVRVDLSGAMRLTSYITRPALEDLSLAVGSRVVAVFKSQAVHLIAH
jgi:molybdopterin-binding protein